MRSFKYAVVLAIGLAGCNSFNQYDPPRSATGDHQGAQQTHPKKNSHGFLSFLFPDDPASEPAVPEPVAPEEVIGPVDARDEQGRLLCPFKRFSPIPAPPPVPIEQLKQLGPKDKDAIIQLLTDHIDALRQYNLRVRDLQEKQRRDYNAECKKWMMQHSE